MLRSLGKCPTRDEVRFYKIITPYLKFSSPQASDAEVSAMQRDSGPSGFSWFSYFIKPTYPNILCVLWLVIVIEAMD